MKLKWKLNDFDVIVLGAHKLLLLCRWKPIRDKILTKSCVYIIIYIYYVEFVGEISTCCWYAFSFVEEYSVQNIYLCFFLSLSLGSGGGDGEGGGKIHFLFSRNFTKWMKKVFKFMYMSYTVWSFSFQYARGMRVIFWEKSKRARKIL